MVARASSVPQLHSSGSSGLENGSANGDRSRNNSRNRNRSRPSKSQQSDKTVNNKTKLNKNGKNSSEPRSRSLNGSTQNLDPQTTAESSSSRNTPLFMRLRDHEIGVTDIVGSRSSAESNPTSPEDNINVVVRVRPLSSKEKRDKHGMILDFPGEGRVIIKHSATSNRQSHHQDRVRMFTYNVVFEPGATQEDILNYSGIKRIVEMAIEGFSCTAFCYGQTGSGKTHTLTGPPELFVGKPNTHDPRHGLIFRSFIYLFQLLTNRKDTNFKLKASFLEIYNERVIDLLNPGNSRKPLAVRWSKKSGGFFVENLFTVTCEELDDLLAVLEEGMRNRSVGSHAMNDHSSRSHTILTVHIISEQETDGGVFLSKHGKINFVDLAGSELTKKTMSEGKTLEEANNINRSLMVLGSCISSLSDNKKRSGHVPYRDSQLTKLLADSLAGNGVTLMIACVSPAHYNNAETLNTLRYACRAKRIRTKPVIIMDPREALILSLKRDIGALETETEHLKAALRLTNERRKQENPKDGLFNPELDEDLEKVETQRLAELDSLELAELVKLYMQENRVLRQENGHLFTVQETVLRDQELVCRENEKLLKTLEEIKRDRMVSTSLTMQNETTTAEIVNSPDHQQSEVWANPLDNAQQKTSEHIGEQNEEYSIQNTKRIAKNIMDMANKFYKKNRRKSQAEQEIQAIYMPDTLI